MEDNQNSGSEQHNDYEVLINRELLLSSVSSDIVENENAVNEARKLASQQHKSRVSSGQSDESDEASISIAESGAKAEFSQSEIDATDEDETVIEEGLIEVEVEDIIGEFNGFANDNLNLFYAPFYVLLLWVFYEETLVAKLYGIKPGDFAYYFIFQVIIV